MKNIRRSRYGMNVFLENSGIESMRSAAGNPAPLFCVEGLNETA